VVKQLSDGQRADSGGANLSYNGNIPGDPQTIPFCVPSSDPC